ncbi:MAG: cell division protein FtsZ [Candidatus Eisenbacteria bacterium]|nr:cell division protein FtsZ [Candidatus Eisenbacteria bacterium]
MFEFDEENIQNATIRVIGIGGAGGNAVDRMVEAGLSNVDFMVANTDCQALARSSACKKIQLGTKLTKGLGSGGDPEIGKRATEEDEDLIVEAVQGADMVFVTAGMGGGTGTGGAPVVAAVARSMGALTVAIVTKPFEFEGKTRMRQADEGLLELGKEVDTLIVIPNQRLISVVERETTLTQAFRMADEVLHQAARGISELITTPGLVNLDFADVRSVMLEKGNALMGTGVGKGPTRAIDAAKAAISSPLLEEVSVAGAEAVLVNITGGADLTLHEVNDAANVITEAAGTDANVLFGAVIDDSMKDMLKITVIATGFGKNGEPKIELVETKEHLELPLGQESLRRPDSRRKEELLNSLGLREKKWNKVAGKDELEIPTFMRRRD